MTVLYALFQLNRFTFFKVLRSRKKFKLCKEQENIPVECQLPASQPYEPYVLHNEKS